MGTSSAGVGRTSGAGVGRFEGVKVEATLLSLCSSNSLIIQATRVSLLRGQTPLQRLREIFDGLLEARLELNLWLPAKHGFGLGDVRLRRSDSALLK